MIEVSFTRLEPFLPALKQYCRQLAGNEWDAEDLLQETLTKLYRSLQSAPEREVTKAYVKRVAHHAWIDHWRKKKAKSQEAIFEEEWHQPAGSSRPDFLIREAFEQLANRLNVRQMVLILLIDIFSFTAPETAKFLHMTVGAVKEGVKRARLRLTELAAEPRDVPDKPPSGKKKEDAAAFMPKDVFEQFLAGFRAGDPAAICRTYLLLTEKGVRVEKICASGGQYSFCLRDPDGHLLSFVQNS
ncbi:sigma-70 family RNA polymerase sigma factor [Brevibacillus fluminis]|uniref:sigma-70 family RNA polymerase sigma factor n=1 Tax=Brevibacillus fluminis TaxID=511487 RepID=UPI003F888B1A